MSHNPLLIEALPNTPLSVPRGPPSITDLMFQVNNKATIWWALYRYFPYLHGTIGPDSVNQPQNAITLSPHVDQFFGIFMIALDQVDGVSLSFHSLLRAPPLFPLRCPSTSQF